MASAIALYGTFGGLFLNFRVVVWQNIDNRGKKRENKLKSVRLQNSGTKQSSVNGGFKPTDSKSVTYLQIDVAILISSQAGILKTAVGHSSPQHTAPRCLHDGIYVGRCTESQSTISTDDMKPERCVDLDPTATFTPSKYISQHANVLLSQY